VHDSVYRDRWHSGDTTYIQVDKYHTIYKDKIVLQHDTICKTETEVQQIEVVKPFYRGCTIAFWFLAVLLVVGLVVYLCIKFIK
jgi:hypothetical protein